MIEQLREMLKDNRVHLAVGQIKKLMLASDRSVLRVMVSILPEQREIVARMAWSTLGASSGMLQLPNVDDLVLVGNADGDEDACFVIAKLSNKEDKIPANAAAGDMVAKANTGTKAWLTSDTKINLSRGDQAPTENLVLGQVFKQLMSDILHQLSIETHIGNLGFSTSPPENAAQYVAKKASPVDDSLVLSDVSFTEK
jgi:hypothetical protein